MTSPIEVWADLNNETVRVGTAHFRLRGSRVTTTVAYEDSYLRIPGAYPIDPELSFDTRTSTTVGLPGAFADSAPDRWGRRLITRRIRAHEGGTPRSITDIDFLLGVSDATRQGALRFRMPGATEFLDPRSDIPKHVRLPELLHAADIVSREEGDDFESVKLLLDAGTGTLGGARPKASVVGSNDHLYIAKFPHHTDEWNVMAWEKTALDLAETAGINTPRRILTSISGRSVLLLERFDRHEQKRIGYMSAMTLIRGNDGDSHDYLDLAGELMDLSASTTTDLEELWRRIAFSVAINNTDDHMRNHGVLRLGAGWGLSPVFDINPNPDVSENRATTINGIADRESTVTVLIDIAPIFGLSPEHAIQILREVAAAIEPWRQVAANNGVSEKEASRFAAVFDPVKTLFPL